MLSREFQHDPSQASSACDNGERLRSCALKAASQAGSPRQSRGRCTVPPLKGERKTPAEWLAVVNAENRGVQAVWKPSTRTSARLRLRRVLGKLCE